MNKLPMRQGDVLLVPVDRLPKGLKQADRDKHDRIVLAEGEHHGHAHALHGANVTGFYKENAEQDASNKALVDFILVGGAGSDLKHEYADGKQAEHDPVALAPGAYKVVQQREELPGVGTIQALD